MLSLLRIENFALIDRLELELNPGLNVLTGETGAGKSIILDAIDIVLGGKATNRAIRSSGDRAPLTGKANRALIEATFVLTSELQDWLKTQEIELLEDDSVVCSRELSATKTSFRSRSRINGVLANRQLIAQLREKLVEITAQGQTVQLMVPEHQRDLLDLYGGAALLNQRQTVANLHEIAQTAKRTLEKRRQSEKDRLQRQDLLQFQLQELDKAELQEPDELDQLETERERLSHVVDLQQLSYQAYQLLYQSDSDAPAVADLLAQAESLLADMAEYDKNTETFLETLKTAQTLALEVGRDLSRYGESLEADPERLDEVETRIRSLKQICRKYGPTLDEAIATYRQLKTELSELTDDEQSLDKLEQDYQLKQEELVKACQQLTQLRQTAARHLEQQLIKALKPLAMAKVLFECRLASIPPNASGGDRVVFYFSPNPGEAVQPLSETASGGEMSRFLLALKACFSQAQLGAGTLIFDEIDAGVSGKVAQAIADKLRELSQQHQVLCVTHQPLVAAMADMHFHVEKQTVEIPNDKDKNGSQDPGEIRTVVRITALDWDKRRDELAQLAGGHSAEEAILFAQSLLAKAAQRHQ